MDPGNHAGMGDRVYCNHSSSSLVPGGTSSMAPLSRSSSFVSVNSVSDLRAPRDLTTESLMTIEDKLRPKHRASRHSSTIQRLNESRSSSLRSLQTDQMSTRPSFRHSFSSNNIPEHRTTLASTCQPSRDPKGEYLFPNGEVFRPRQKPRNRSHRPHRTIYAQNSRSASVPNLEKQMREVSSHPPFTEGFPRPSHGFRNFGHRSYHDLKPSLDVANHPRSNSSSAASVTAANSPTSSPSPKTETPASSIQNDESVVLELDLKKSLLEAEVVKMQAVKEETSNTPRDIISKDKTRDKTPLIKENYVNRNIDTQRSRISEKKNVEDISRPTPVKKGSSAATVVPATSQHGAHTETTKQRVARRPSLMSRVISKLFGRDSDKKKEATSRKRSFLSLRKSRSIKESSTQIKQPPPTAEQNKPQKKEKSPTVYCNDAEETKSFEQGDEPEALVVSKEEAPDSSLKLGEEKVDLDPTPEEILYFSKVIELGETPFPDLAEPDLGSNRRQKKRVQSLERKKSLNRNASLTSTHSSIKTSKTTGTSSSVNSFDLEEHIHDLHRYFRRGPSSNDESCLSNVEIITSNEIKSPCSCSTPITPCLRTSDFMTSRNSSYSSIFKADSKTSINSDSSSYRQPQADEPKKVSFSNKLYLNRALSPSSYDRFNCVLKEQYHILSNTPNLIQDIRSELNNFKSSMEVHESSRQYTHYFNA